MICHRNHPWTTAHSLTQRAAGMRRHRNCIHPEGTALSLTWGAIVLRRYRIHHCEPGALASQSPRLPRTLQEPLIQILSACACWCIKASTPGKRRVGSSHTEMLDPKCGSFKCWVGACGWKQEHLCPPGQHQHHPCPREQSSYRQTFSGLEGTMKTANTGGIHKSSRPAVFGWSTPALDLLYRRPRGVCPSTCVPALSQAPDFRMRFGTLKMCSGLSWIGGETQEGGTPDCRDLLQNSSWRQLLCQTLALVILWCFSDWNKTWLIPHKKSASCHRCSKRHALHDFGKVTLSHCFAAEGSLWRLFVCGKLQKVSSFRT